MSYIARRLNPLLDRDFSSLAEIRHPDGSCEPIGFLVALRDFNQAIAPTRGRLFPLGWLKFLLAARRIRTLRLLMFGIKQEWRLPGSQAVMFAESPRAMLPLGVP